MEGGSVEANAEGNRSAIDPIRHPDSRRLRAQQGTIMLTNLDDFFHHSLLPTVRA
jgi:hypothetical protein